MLLRCRLFGHRLVPAWRTLRRGYAYECTRRGCTHMEIRDQQW